MTLSTWIEAQREASARALADVVSATDLVHERPGLGQRVRPRRGSVLASRHPGLWDPEPDYVHHWVRDAAIVFLAARRIGGNGWPRRMADYVAFSLEIATRPGPPGNPLAASARPDHRRFLRPDAELAALTGDALLGEPRAGADGSADAERWSRPQYDGPALRALSLLRWTGRRDAAMERLLAIDLDHVCRHAARPCIGPWEEEGEDDLHAFTLIAQRIALAEGLGAGLLPEEGARAPLDRIDAALETLWRPGPGHLAARAGSADTDAAVILAALLAGDDAAPFGPADPRIRASAAALEDWSAAAYPLNRGAPVPLVGRNPADRYFGANPWVPVTLAMAELHFRLATAPAHVDATGGGPQALGARGDACLAALAARLPTAGALPEQLDRATGEPRSCPDLAWSHAAFLEATAAREAAIAAGAFRPGKGS